MSVVGFILTLKNKNIQMNISEKNTKSSKHIYWIQSLRAFAAIYVMMFHCIPFWNHLSNDYLSNILVFISSHGYVGVDIFFVISGYVIGLSLREKEKNIKTGVVFILKRFTRIFSGYWPILLLTIIFAYVGIRPVADIAEKLMDSILLLSKKPDGNILDVAWSLSYELTFYIFSFAAFFLLRNYNFILILSLAFMIIFGYNLYWFVLHENIIFGGVWPLRYTLNGMALEFFLGLYITVIKKDVFKNKELLPLFLVIAALAFTIGTHSIFFANYELLRACSFGLFGVAILCSALTLEACEVKPLKALNLLGDASYSLYLIHPLFLAVIGASLGLLTQTVKDIVIIFMPFVCLLLSIVWYLHVEKHLYKKTTNWMLSRLFK